MQKMTLGKTRAKPIEKYVKYMERVKNGKKDNKKKLETRIGR